MTPQSSPPGLAVLHANGIELAYEERGAGAPLLLLHGFLGAGSDFRHLPGLGAGRRSIVPDLRGHGRSTFGASDRASVFTHRQAAADVLALLDRLGVERCAGLGLSGGANTLLHLAIAHPTRIERLVLVSACDTFPPEARAFMDAYTLESRSEQEWAEMRARHAQGDAQIEALFRQARAFKDSDDDMNLTPAELVRIAAPTLLVTGDRDPLCPLEVALRMYCAISQAALWVVPQAGHLPVFGEDMRAFVARANRFLGCAGPESR